MARPLSPEKRTALLQAAAQSVAEMGVLATTASIAKRAGVAEGSLFTYFASKDELLQALYLVLKTDLSEAVMPDYPHQAQLQERMQHVFDRYVRWGLANPDGRLALARLSASGLVVQQTLEQASQPFVAVYEMMVTAVQQAVFREAPIAFLTSVIEDIADTTIEYMDRFPEQAAHYQRLGFDIVWKAITV